MLGPQVAGLAAQGDLNTPGHGARKFLHCCRDGFLKGGWGGGVTTESSLDRDAGTDRDGQHRSDSLTTGSVGEPGPAAIRMKIGDEHVALPPEGHQARAFSRVVLQHIRSPGPFAAAGQDRGDLASLHANGTTKERLPAEQGRSDQRQPKEEVRQALALQEEIPDLVSLWFLPIPAIRPRFEQRLQCLRPVRRQNAVGTDARCCTLAAHRASIPAYSALRMPPPPPLGRTPVHPSPTRPTKTLWIHGIGRQTADEQRTSQGECPWASPRGHAPDATGPRRPVLQRSRTESRPRTAAQGDTPG